MTYKTINLYIYYGTFEENLSFCSLSLYSFDQLRNCLRKLIRQLKFFFFLGGGGGGGAIGGGAIAIFVGKTIKSLANIKAKKLKIKSFRGVPRGNEWFRP
jgi:hypothetical protein